MGLRFCVLAYCLSAALCFSQTLSAAPNATIPEAESHPKLIATHDRGLRDVAERTLTSTLIGRCPPIRV